MAFQPAQKLPPGLLSFLYSVIYDNTVKNAFRQNPTDVMDYFQLDKDVQAAIQTSGDDGKPVDEHILVILAYLFPDLKQDYYIAW